MCVAVSGLLLERTEHTGKVDICGNILSVELGLVNAQPGDFVLVHAGCAISIVPGREKEELDELYRLMEEVLHDDSR